PHSYLQDLNERITEAMFTASDATVIDRPGGVFLRRADIMSAEDRLMSEATARVQVQCDGRALRSVLDAARDRESLEYDEFEDDEVALRPSGRSTPPSLSVVQRLRAHATELVQPFSPVPTDGAVR